MEREWQSDQRESESTATRTIEPRLVLEDQWSNTLLQLLRGELECAHVFARLSLDLLPLFVRQLDPNPGVLVLRVVHVFLDVGVRDGTRFLMSGQTYGGSLMDRESLFGPRERGVARGSLGVARHPHKPAGDWTATRPRQQLGFPIAERGQPASEARPLEVREL